MNTKKTYHSPKIEKVLLDNQIALVMMSPIGDPPPIRKTPSFGDNEQNTSSQPPFVA